MSELRADRLHLSHGSRPVLRDACLTVSPGEMVALVGPNGAGKSTLLRSVSGELTPNSGACFVDRMDVHRAKAGELARRRAVLPQDVAIGFPLAVEQVIAMARAPWRRRATPQQNRRAVFEAATAAGVSALMQRDYRHLSGGERQRVQMARVLAQVWDVHWDGKPRYLLLDEPTASLDVGHQQRLLDVVRSVLSKGVGVLAVLHDLNLAATFAERIYLLSGGRIRAEGAPTAVIRSETINAIYDARLEVETDTRSGRPMVLPAQPRVTSKTRLP